MVNRRVAIKSKWGPAYVGILKSTDPFMNILLAECFSYGSAASQAPGADPGPEELGDVLLRCNNVLYVREVPQTGDVPALFAA
jgi:small nuclear ribonucleoprotein F